MTYFIIYLFITTSALCMVTSRPTNGFSNVKIAMYTSKDEAKKAHSNQKSGMDIQEWFRQMGCACGSDSDEAGNDQYTSNFEVTKDGQPFTSNAGDKMEAYAHDENAEPMHMEGEGVDQSPVVPPDDGPGDLDGIYSDTRKNLQENPDYTFEQTDTEQTQEPKYDDKQEVPTLQFYTKISEPPKTPIEDNNVPCIKCTEDVDCFKFIDPMVPDPNPRVPDPNPMAPHPDPMAPHPDPMAPAPDPQLPDPDPMAPNPDPMGPCPDPMQPCPDPCHPCPDKCQSCSY